MTVPVLEWEIQWQQPYGRSAIWANNGTLDNSRGAHRMKPNETAQEAARTLVRAHLPREGAYRIAIWDAIGVGRPPILLASWGENETMDVRPYGTATAV
jgi:hypothetical protein